MIDLKKEGLGRPELKDDGFGEKSKSVNENEKKQDTLIKEKNAKKFLCVALSLIVAFTGIVCAFVAKRNETLRAEHTIKEFEAAVNESSTAAPEKPKDTLSEDTQKGDALQDTTPEKSPQETAAANYNIPVAGTFDNPAILKITQENKELILINSCYRMDKSYEPDLVYLFNGDQRLDREAAAAYEKMYNAGLKDNVTLTPYSGYRSYERQERNYKRKIDFYIGQGYSEAEAKKKAATIILPPGSSEHNLGIAMDIVCADSWFEGTDEFKWLNENAHNYGFILRYPEDKVDITDVIYEPWHWRYVGVENAKKIKDSGLCLEEYLGVAK